MILNLSLGVSSLLLKIKKLVGNHLQEKQQNPSLQLFRKVKTIKKRHWNTSYQYRHTHPFFGGRLRHGQEDLRKTIRRSYGGFGRECGHMGRIHEFHSQSSNSSRKSPWREFENCKQLFLEIYRTTFRWDSSGQTETTGISLIDSKDLKWISTSLLHSRAYQYANAKIYVFSDSVLCLGRMGPDPVEIWKKQIQWYSETNYFSELNRVDGKPMEFEWKIFPQFTTAGILNDIQKMMGESQCDPADFKDRIIFMSMFDDIVWDATGYEELCENNSKRVEECARRFPRGHWSFLGPGSEKKWYVLGSDCGEDDTKFPKIPVTQYSVVPVPWREDNQEASMRQQFLSTEVQKILSCSSRWSSLPISSVFTVQ